MPDWTHFRYIRIRSEDIHRVRIEGVDGVDDGVFVTYDLRGMADQQDAITILTRAGIAFQTSATPFGQ